MNFSRISQGLARSLVPALTRSPLVLSFLAVALCSAAHANTSVVDVQRVDTAVRVQASATVQATSALTWNTLIAYDRLPQFIPGMLSSKTLQRSGNEVLVEQRGRAGLGPFKQDFSLTLAVREDLLRTVQAKAVAGDFSRFESSYRIFAQDERRTRIEYDALIEPKAGIPPLVGLPVMRVAIRRQFEALLGEIERQAANAPPATTTPGLTPVTP